MFTGICAALGALLGVAFVRRRSQRAMNRAKAGQPVLFSVGAKRPDLGRRWSLGRVRSEVEEFRWEPRWSWTRLRELPADLRFFRVREPKGREWLWIPIDAFVIECESPEGPVWLWVMGAQWEHVAGTIRQGRT